MNRTVRALVRVAAAWLCTYVLAAGLAELAAGRPGERAARCAAALPPDDARDPVARRAIVERFERELELGGGAGARLARAAWHAATFDLGRSWRDRRPVGEVIDGGLGATGARAGLAVIIAVVLGMAGGLAAAGRRGPGGVAAGAVIAAGLAVPTLWLCQLGLAGWSPGPAGARALAVAALAVAPAAVIAAHVRATAEELLASPLAAAVRARGASTARLLVVHGARLAVPRLAPLAASTVGFVLGASAVVERAVAVPGAGRILADAAAAGDVPVVAALAGLAAATVAAAGAAADAIAARIDPRLDPRVDGAGR